MADDLEVQIIGNMAFWQLYEKANTWKTKLSKSTHHIEELIKWSYLCAKDMCYIGDNIKLFENSDTSLISTSLQEPKHLCSQEVVF
jgi:hypothetical protein